MYNKAKNANITPQKLNLFLACEDACVKCLAWLKGAQKLISTTYLRMTVDLRKIAILPLHYSLSASS